MTDPTPTQPATVVVPAGTQAMEFRTIEPTTGQPISAAQQFKDRLQNPQWVKDASVPGTPANAEFTRLTHQQAVDKIGGASGINPTELADELRGYGLSPARVAEEMRLLGVDPGDIPGAGRTAPEAFRLPYSEPLTEPEQLAADKAVRSWMSEAGFEVDAGSNFADAVNQLASRTWDETSLNQHIERGRATLRKVWAGDFEKNVALLDRFIDDVEAKAPGLNDFLHEHPFVLSDPLIAHQLLGMARRKYG